MNNKVYRLSMSAMFVAVMMVLSYIESLIPILENIIPNYKIGLANSALLLSLYWLGIKNSTLLMITRVLLTALMFGRIGVLPLSLAGGVLSLIVMIVLIYLVKGISPVGAGVAGAVAHNVGQVGMAMLIMNNSGILRVLPILMVIAILSGALTGTVAKLLMYYLPKERKALFSQT